MPSESNESKRSTWRRATRTVGAFVGGLVCLLAPLAAQPLATSQDCPESQWSFFGAEALHCPGGICTYSAASGDEARFRLSTQPWLRAVEDRVAPGIREGDVLVAVNDLPVTTPGGGTALANLAPSAIARLTVQRGARRLEIEARPEQRCGAPLMLVGTSLLERSEHRHRHVDDHSAEPWSSAATREGLLIDHSKPFRTRGSALDLSLGMVLHCSRCTLETDAKRWSIDDYPEIVQVTPGGVAEESGLQVGDRLVSISGRDLQSQRGGELLFAPPDADFRLRYERSGSTHSASINRRIVEQRIRVVRDRRVRIERGDGSWDAGMLGALVRAWSRLTEGDAELGTRDWTIGSERWSLPSWGLSFEAREGRFLRLDGTGQRLRLLAAPTVAEIDRDGPADRAGLRAGDRVLEIDGHPILGSNGTRRLLLGDPEKKVGLRVRRDGRVLTITLDPETR